MAELSDRPVARSISSEQLKFARGLATCSRILSQPASSEVEKAEILQAALEALRQATQTSRAFLYRNFDDAELGFCSGTVAVAYDRAYPPEITVNWLLERVPWSIAPKEVIDALAAGQPAGGRVDDVFATTPAFLQTLHDDGVLSVQFFPVHSGDVWWGYVGFDDREESRQWQESEIVLLRAAAEMFANALQRWQTGAALARHSRYEEALSHCSRVLHRARRSEDQGVAILGEALEYLRQAVDASRVYLFENFTDPELGLCLGMRVEVCAPGVKAQIDNPVNQRFPWSDLPVAMRQTLEDGKPYGGPVEQTFASTPTLVQAFRQQKNPLLSTQQFPIHFGERWWGFIGFDEVKTPREWSSEEIRVLRVASEIIGNTLQRWETEVALRAELEERRRREERLRLLESVVVNMSEGVLVTDVQSDDPRILYVNEAFTRITGYTVEEVIGQSPRMLQGPRTSREILELVRDALDRREPVDVELVHYRKDGSEFWVEMSITPVFNQDGDCTHFVAIQRDVTERRHTREALELAREELEERVAVRTSQILRVNKDLHYEIANRKRAEAEVKKRLEIEQALAAISKQLVETTEFRNILPGLLRDVAAMVDARRVALVFFDAAQEAIGEIYDWHSPQTAPLEPGFLTEILPAFAWMRKQLEANQAVFFEDLQQMPVAATAEKEIIQEMGTQSVAAFPLQVDGELTAILISSNFVRQDGESGQQLDILNVIAELLRSALQREALLNSLEQRAIDRSRELAAFYDMTMMASEAEKLSDILQPALIQIMEAVRCQAISVHGLSADRESLGLVAQYGLSQERNIQAEALAARFRHWFDDLNEPIIAHRPGETEWLPAALRPDGFVGYIGAQLRARGKALGILSCYRQIERPFSLNSTALVVALAEQLGIIIENYRLRQQAEEQAIIEERQRLARDLHDAITQSLYSVTLFARASVDALEEGDAAKAAETMGEVEHNALRTLKEMRLLLHQLQPLVLEQGGLEQAIESRLNEVERRLGIKVTVVIASGLSLRPRAEETLYRIITEALNNSLRHADASAVRVLLEETQGRLRLEVQDNGRGFDLAAHRLGMGIKNMQERAAMLQGTLTVTSTVGAGTGIVVDLPREWLE